MRTKTQRRSTAKTAGKPEPKRPASRGVSGGAKGAGQPASAFSATSPTMTVHVDSVQASLKFCALTLGEVAGILLRLAEVVTR